MKPTHLALGLCALALSSSAQRHPGLQFVDVEPLALPSEQVAATGLEVDLAIDGPALRVTQRVTLTNFGANQAEYDLIFPIAGDVVVSALDLRLGDTTLEGMVYDADQAREIYRQITRAQRDPALLEHYGDGMYRARVFPIPPGESQVLTFSYSQVLRAEGELLRVDVPLTMWHRDARPLPLSIRGEVLSNRPVSTFYSPSHELEVSPGQELGSEPVRHSTRFAINEEGSRCEHDLLLFLKTARGAGLLDVTLLTENTHPEEDGYFLAVVNGNPSARIEPEPKDVVFVLDTSGSMEGRKLEQAREALQFLVERLRPEDRFNLISYSVDVVHFGNELATPDSETLGRARHFLDGLSAEGGTNIEGALQAALGQFADDERLHQVVFLTDGLPTVGERDMHQLAKTAQDANAHGARLIAFGVGFDVNGALLDRLAVQNHGLSEYVLPTESIEDKVPGFYGRMQSPLLIDAAFEVAGLQVHDVYPQELGDLYAGHQLLLVGRYALPPESDGGATLRVSGRRGDAHLTAAFDVQFSTDGHSGTKHKVARLWASKKVGFLVDEIRLHGEDPELVAEIVRLGTRYGILTEYTSFLAAPQADLLSLDLNLDRALEEVEARVQTVSGSHGVAQALNSKLRQRSAAGRLSNSWMAEDGAMVAFDNVIAVGGRTYWMRDEGWVESAAAPSADRDVELFSDEFFTLLDQNAWLASNIARTGEVVMAVGDEMLRFRR